MKLSFFATLMLACIPTIALAQDMDVDATLSYVNSKLRSNVITTEMFGRVRYEVSFTDEGEVVIKRYPEGNYHNEYRFSARDIDTRRSFKECKTTSSGITFHCKFGTSPSYEQDRCVESTTYGLGRSANHPLGYAPDVEKDQFVNTSISFSNVNRIGPSMCNAFAHLLSILSLDPKFQVKTDPSDPFASPSASAYISITPRSGIVPLKRNQDGTFRIPVTINNVLTIDFTLDSGASEVYISPDVALTLLRTGTVSEPDFIGSKTYTFADGSTAESERFVIRTLSVGQFTLRNVTAAISSSINAPMLLGQNVLSKLGRVTIDYDKSTLFIQK